MIYQPDQELHITHAMFRAFNNAAYQLPAPVFKDRATVRRTEVNRSRRGWQGRLAHLINLGWQVESQDGLCTQLKKIVKPGWE